MYFIPRFDPRLKFECAKCGNCCGRGLNKWLLELYPVEVKILSEMGYSDLIVKYGEHYFLSRSKDGSCIFLGKDNLCILRKEYEWYPANCRIFPFSTTIINNVLVIYVNMDYVRKVRCKGFGKGAPLGAQVDNVLDALRDVGVLRDYFVVSPSSSEGDILSR